jgi:hypothetical protein
MALQKPEEKMGWRNSPPLIWKKINLTYATGLLKENDKKQDSLEKNLKMPFS